MPAINEVLDHRVMEIIEECVGEYAYIFPFYVVFLFCVFIRIKADNCRLDIIGSELLTALLYKPQLIIRNHCVRDGMTEAKQNNTCESKFLSGL
jgi:hypothetical protein